MSEKMLVVVDYQNDFVDGELGFEGADRLDKSIAEKIHAYSKAGDVVLATRDTHFADYLDTREGKALPVIHCVAGDAGWQLYGETGRAMEIARVNEQVDGTGPVEYLSKSTFGCSPRDMLRLQTRFNPKEIEIVGLVTNMCVISNVCCFQAAWPEAQIIVDASLVDSFDKELHRKTLDVLKGLQVNVVGEEN